MNNAFPHFLQPSPYTSHFATVDLDDARALQLARMLPRGPEQPPLHFLIDCGRISCQRTLGVNHVISQLLMLRKAGAVIWLRNVNATLERCLRLLQLQGLFNIATDC